MRKAIHYCGQMFCGHATEEEADLCWAEFSERVRYESRKRTREKNLMPAWCYRHFDMSKPEEKFIMEKFWSEVAGEETSRL